MVKQRPDWAAVGRSGDVYSEQREQKMHSPGRGTSLGLPRNRKDE